MLRRGGSAEWTTVVLSREEEDGANGSVGSDAARKAVDEDDEDGMGMGELVDVLDVDVDVVVDVDVDVLELDVVVDALELEVDVDDDVRVSKSLGNDDCNRPGAERERSDSASSPCSGRSKIGSGSSGELADGEDDVDDDSALSSKSVIDESCRLGVVGKVAAINCSSDSPVSGPSALQLVLLLELLLLLLEVAVGVGGVEGSAAGGVR